MTRAQFFLAIFAPVIVKQLPLKGNPYISYTTLPKGFIHGGNAVLSKAVMSDFAQFVTDAWNRRNEID